MPEGQYIAVQAIADGDSFAMQIVQKEKSYDLYNKQGASVGSKHFNSSQEMLDFDNAVAADMLAYNGQHVYFEGVNELEIPADFVVIP